MDSMDGRELETVTVKTTNGAHNLAKWTPGNADALRGCVNSGDAFLFTLLSPFSLPFKVDVRSRKLEASQDT